MGTRENAAAQDFSGIPLEEEEESHLKDAAVISMGTEISGEDMMNIEALCDQVTSQLCLCSFSNIGLSFQDRNHMCFVLLCGLSSVLQYMSHEGLGACTQKHAVLRPVAMQTLMRSIGPA